jgi:hypothetical protein
MYTIIWFENNSVHDGKKMKHSIRVILYLCAGRKNKIRVRYNGYASIRVILYF